MNMMCCKQCGSSCVFARAFITCSECGLEQENTAELVSEPNVMDRVAVLESSPHQFNKRVKDSLSILEDCFSFSEDLQSLTATLLQDIFEMSEHKIKGEMRYLEVTCAALYFASRSMNSGAFSHKMITDKIHVTKGICIGSFQWACKWIQNELGSKKQYSELFIKKQPKLEDSVSRLLQNLTADMAKKEKEQVVRIIRPIIIKIQDRIKGDARVSVCQPEKLNAAIMFMACKIGKVPMTLKNTALLLKTSEPTLLKLEKLLQDVLKSTQND